jgi:peptidyl-prolyl cis-trans isomerase C
MSFSSPGATLRLLVVVIALAGFTVSAVAQDPEVVVRLGKVEITTLDLEAEMQGMTPQQRNNLLKTPGAIGRMAGTLLYWRVVALQAAETGLHEDPLTRARIRNMNDRALGQIYLADENSQLHPASKVEAMARADFNAHPEDYSAPETLRARHILIGRADREGNERSAEAAQQLIDEVQRKLADGEEFEALAKAYSEDPGSARRGGDLGSFKRGRMVEAFEEAVFAMQPGEVSAPVETRFGWHIIRLESREGGERPTFDQVRERAIAQTRARLMADYHRQLTAAMENDPDLTVFDDVVEAFTKRKRGD